MNYEYLEGSNGRALTTTSIIAKIKQETKYESNDLKASPIFLRANNQGTYSLIVALFKTFTGEDKKTMLTIEQLLTFDLNDGSDITHESARKHFDKMDIDIRTPFCANRKDLNKELAREYGPLVSPTMDRLRLKVLEDGIIDKKEYLEYLKMALYFFTEEVADAFATLSRLFLYNQDATIICKDCKREYRISIAKYNHGDLIKSKCPNCHIVNQTACTKSGSVVSLRKDYRDLRHPETEEKISTLEELTDKENFSVDTKAVISKDAARSGEALSPVTVTKEALNAQWSENANAPILQEAESISLDEAMEVTKEDSEPIQKEETDTPSTKSPFAPLPEFTPLPDEEETTEEVSAEVSEVLPEEEPAPETEAEGISSLNHSYGPTSGREIIGLSKQKTIFQTIASLQNRPHPAYLFTLVGDKGRGMLTSVIHFAGYKREDITIARLSEFAPSDFLTPNHCFVCLIHNTKPASELLYETIRNLPDTSCVFFAGTNKDMEWFKTTYPDIAELILYHINFNPYSPEELLQLFTGALSQYGLTVPDIPLAEVEEFIKNMNAVSIKAAAGAISFKHMLSKPGISAPALSFIKNELKNRNKN